VETGAAVVFGHHFAKGSAAGKEQLDRASGSGVFARYADSIITLTQHEAEAAYAAEATLRNFPPIEPFALRWLWPLMRPDTGLDPAKLKQAVGRKKTHWVQDILDCLQKDMTTQGWQQAAAENGIARTNFFRLKKEAEEAGQVVSKSGGKTNTWERTGKVVVPFKDPGCANPPVAEGNRALEKLLATEGVSAPEEKEQPQAA
jgi:hypothetical protein